MVQEAESKFGNLYKIQKDFIDSSSGSKFQMVFAAKKEKILNQFLSENEIEIRGITLDKKNEIISKANKKSFINKNPIEFDQKMWQRTWMRKMCFMILYQNNLKVGI